MLVLQNVYLIDGTGGEPVRGTNVAVEGNRIHAIGAAPQPGDQVVECEGRALIPGLFNCHGHVMLSGGAASHANLSEPIAYRTILGANRAKAILRAGITTFRDVSGVEYVELSLRRAINEGLIPGPRLLCAAMRLTMTGGFFGHIGREVDGVDDVRKAVRENRKAGADLIKLVASGGQRSVIGCEPGPVELSEEELRAGASEAARLGLTSAAHAVGTTAIKNAVRAGVTSLEHGNFLDQEGVELMLERGTVLVPTFSVTYAYVEHGRELGYSQADIDSAKQSLEAAMESFQLARRQGVPIAMGSDAGTPFNPHDDLLTEFKLSLEAGQTPMGAIVSATKTAAELCRQPELGTIEPGKIADLVVLDGNPLDDINAIGRPWLVVKDGTPVQ